MSVSLYRKYRPQKFSSVTGQETIVKILSNSAETGRIGHAYLFVGSRGIGKTTLARIFGRVINCLDGKKEGNFYEPCGKCQNCRSILESKTMDFIEIDAASNTGVDNIRQLKETINLPPSSLKYKVYIIDEVHMLSLGAFNALLKTLEEPPAHAVFILATTEIHKIPETIISRCSRFDFKRLNFDQIVKRLSNLAENENITIEKSALETIALEAEGGMRDAESLLHQVFSLKDKDIKLEEVQEILGISSKKKVFDFLFILSGIKEENVFLFMDKLSSSGIRLKNFTQSAISLLRDLIISKSSPESTEIICQTLSSEEKTSFKKLRDYFSFENLIFLIEKLHQNLELMKYSPVQSLPLEMLCIEFFIKIGRINPLVQSKLTTFPSPPSSPTIKTTISQNINNASLSKIEEKETDIENLNQKKVSTTTKSVTAIDDNPSVPKIPLTTILDKWGEIISAIKSTNNLIGGCLSSCIPLGTVNQKLFIKTKNNFHKEKLSEHSCRLTIKKELDRILGSNFQIEFIEEKEAERIKLDPNEDENQDILHQAMKIFGGKIV